MKKYQVLVPHSQDLKSEIAVNGYGSEEFKVTPRWDGKNCICKLYIDGDRRAYELWEISQRALSSVFFKY